MAAARQRMPLHANLIRRNSIRFSPSPNSVLMIKHTHRQWNVSVLTNVTLGLLGLGDVGVS